MKDNGIRVEYEESDYSRNKGFDFEALRKRHEQRAADAKKIHDEAVSVQLLQTGNVREVLQGNVHLSQVQSCESRSKTGRKCGQPKLHTVRHSNGLETWD